MKINALITTLALIGSSSVAMARPVTVSASVKAKASWSIGTRTPAPAPVVVRDHRTTYPTYQPAVRRPVYQQPIHEDSCNVNDLPSLYPNNNTLTEDASVYKGPLPIAGNKRTRFRDSYNYGYQAASTWLAITAPTRIERGRQFVTDLPNLGTFSTVRFQRSAGTTSISQVLIRFVDGGEQLVTLDRTLDQRTPTIDIRLAGGARQIHGFVVYGATGYGSAYQILAL